MTKRLTIALVALALFVLVAVLPVSAAYYTVNIGVNQSAQVFIGEQGLNLTHALNAITWVNQSGDSTTFAKLDAVFPTSNFTIGWWASAAQVTTTSPSQTIDLTSRYRSFTVAQSDFVGYTGVWYAVNPATGLALTYAPNGGAITPIPVINVQDPTLTVSVWDFNQLADVTGKSVTQGEKLGFKVGTNQVTALGTSRYNESFYLRNSPTMDPILTQGYLDIVVKPDTGATLTQLLDGQSNLGNLTQLNVSYQPWIWGQVQTSLVNANPRVGTNWSTDARDSSNQLAYPAGTYTVYAKSKLNNMYDNYKNGGADFTGKTISQVATITLVSDTVKIESNKDTVVRSKPFSVTVTGKPSTVYVLWVKGTSSMTNGYDNQAPIIAPNQLNVNVSQNDFRSSLAGSYQYQNGGGTQGSNTGMVANDTPLFANNGWQQYADIKTATDGTITVQFMTTNYTKAQQYTIRVERNDNLFTGVTPGVNYKSDEVTVNVQKGAVTIVAAGDQSYYLGEEVKFSGTNTETYNTYLFITGPNLQALGSSMLAPKTAIVGGTGDANLVNAAVQGDNTWSYKWGTASIELDAGTYTIYAESQPLTNTAANLATEAFGTVSIIIKKPFVSATASQSVIAQGDNLFVTGTAEGNPTPGIAIWILGKNYGVYTTQSVNSDASFSYEITKTTTKPLAAGQYFIVVQHPMQNNIFDIYPIGGTSNNPMAGDIYVVNRLLNAAGNTGTGSNLFKISGTNSLQGSDAAEALVEGITTANVDDTYTKLQFLVEVPAITIDPIGDKHVGDKFTITATTNLAVDDQILVQVYSSSFKPTQKSQSGEFSGATGTVKVTKGDGGLNKISFDVDSSTFKPDEYIVTEDAVLQTATGTALFNVLEGAAPTVAPTAVVTTAAPTTAVPTTIVTTTAPTQVPTTKSPGYGALIALIGLGAVAFIVVRRH